MMAAIYIFTLPNGKQYVGQTIDLRKRYGQHRNKRKMLVDKAVHKYGWSNVVKETMSCAGEHLDWMEREWIKTLGSISPAGYNLESGGLVNRQISKETRRKMSNAHKGQSPSSETRRKLSEANFGKAATYPRIITKINYKQHKHTEEARKKIAASRIGKPRSAMTKMKIAATQKARLTNGR